jgi:outer membrane autotransporter protein
MNGKLAIAKIAAAGAVAIGMCASAGAADLSLSRRVYTKEAAPLPIMQPLYNWTGFYVGANFGGAFANEDASNFGSFSTDPSGVLGGFQFGYNYQYAPNLLLGIEGEIDWTSADSTNNFSNGAVAASLRSNHNWYDTLDGRLGWIQGAWLLYVKGGVAWMNADYTMTAAGGGFAFANSTNITRVGWNVGVGAEYQIMPQWTAKVEYNYLDFGSDNVNFAVPVFGGSNINTQVHEFKVGVNYHWIPGTLFGRW